MAEVSSVNLISDQGAKNVINQNSADILKLNERIQTAFGHIDSVRDSVAVVQGAVTGHEAKFDIAKSVIDQSKADIVQLSQRILAAYDDIATVKDAVNSI